MISYVALALMYLSAILIYYSRHADLAEYKELPSSKVSRVSVVEEASIESFVEDEETGFERTRLEDMWESESELVDTLTGASIEDSDSLDKFPVKFNEDFLFKVLQFMFLMLRLKPKFVRFHPRSFKHQTFSNEIYDRANPETFDQLEEIRSNYELRNAIRDELYLYKTFEMKTHKSYMESPNQDRSASKPKVVKSGRKKD